MYNGGGGGGEALSYVSSLLSLYFMILIVDNQ